MAEGLARAIWDRCYREKGDLRVSSAGVAAWSGEAASPKAIRALMSKGISLESHRSRILTREIVEGAGLILTMTGNHLEQILQNHPQVRDRVFTLTEFTGAKGDVTDPYGGSQEVYDHCAGNLERLITDALKRIADGSGGYLK